MDKESFRKEILRRLPVKFIFKPKDIATLGILSCSGLSRLRRLGKGPKYFKMSERGFGYFRDDLIDWIVENMSI